MTSQLIADALLIITQQIISLSELFNFSHSYHFSHRGHSRLPVQQSNLPQCWLCSLTSPHQQSPFAQINLSWYEGKTTSSPAIPTPNQQLHSCSQSHNFFFGVSLSLTTFLTSPRIFNLAIFTVAPLKSSAPFVYNIQYSSSNNTSLVSHDLIVANPWCILSCFPFIFVYLITFSILNLF